MRNIADASAEQSDAILQINTGVDQISDVVAANTSTAIGSASASEELSGQSLILKNMIAKFKLYNTGAQPVQNRNTSAAAAFTRKEPEQEYDFNIDLESGTGARPTLQAPDADAAPVSPEESHVSDASRSARVQMNRVKNIFMKSDEEEDSEEDEAYYKNLAGLFGKTDSDEDDEDGEEDSSKGSKRLGNLFMKKDSDDGSEDNVGKKDINALFKIDVDDDDDKY